MATKQELLIEANRRGLLTGEKKQAFDLAVSRGLIAMPKQQITQQQFTQQYGDIPDIDGIVAPQEPAPEASMGEKAIGLAEAGLTTATGATGGLLGMIGGTFGGLIDEIRSGKFGSNEAANRIEQRATELMGALTYQPRTEQGQEYVQEIGEAGAALAPLAGLGGPMAQMGQLGKAATPQLQAAGRQAATMAQPAKSTSKALFSYQSPTKQKIAQLLESGVPDEETARFRITKPSLPSPDQPQSKVLQALNAGGAKVAKDKIAISAIDQGFDEGVIASIKVASKTDKTDMSRMLNMFEKGKKNQLFAAKNRPTDVIGDRVLNTFNEVRAVNRKAGTDIDRASRALKGLQVDSAPIGSKFITDLADMGIGVGDDMKLIFKGSDVEDLKNVERTLSTVFRRMTGDKAPDAYELHRMKRFIDEQVAYGKAGEGLTGKSESLLKSLRRDIDSTLDNKFESYDKANTMYSDTIQALDDIQTVAGKRMDLTGDNANKALGTLMRRVLSNAQSRVNIVDALSSLDDVAKKYPSQLAIEGAKKAGTKPDLTQLILFADELDSRFKPVARGSFQGQIDQAINRGVRSAAGSPEAAATDVAAGLATRGYNKIKGISDDNAFKAMRELLNRGDE
jgi:hypothetical protein